MISDLLPNTSGVLLGIYEKALAGDSLEQIFLSARRAGFSFIDLSIDESAQRLQRLSWGPQERREIRESADRAGIALGGVCLSVHRSIAPGSVDPEQRHHALDILLDAIDFCVDLHIPVLQIAGYYAYYEEPREGARADYVEVLSRGTEYAARRGVMLALENVDGTDVVSTQKALEIIHDIDSPWFTYYPDMGNFAVQSLDVVEQVQQAAPHAVAWHVKDARPGEPRRVEMGTGDVPWAAAFEALAVTGWSGRIMIEMWNDDSPESEKICRNAREFISNQLTNVGITVLDGSMSRGF